MEPRQKLDEKVKGIELDCGKCPISKEDCLEILEIIEEGKGGYSTKGNCLLKILLRDTARFFHL